MDIVPRLLHQLLGCRWVTSGGRVLPLFKCAACALALLQCAGSTTGQQAPTVISFTNKNSDANVAPVIASTAATTVAFSAPTAQDVIDNAEQTTEATDLEYYTHVVATESTLTNHQNTTGSANTTTANITTGGANFITDRTDLANFTTNTTGYLDEITGLYNIKEDLAITVESTSRTEFTTEHQISNRADRLLADYHHKDSTVKYTQATDLTSLVGVTAYEKPVTGKNTELDDTIYTSTASSLAINVSESSVYRNKVNTQFEETAVDHSVDESTTREPAVDYPFNETSSTAAVPSIDPTIFYSSKEHRLSTANSSSDKYSLLGFLSPSSDIFVTEALTDSTTDDQPSRASHLSSEAPKLVSLPSTLSQEPSVSQSLYLSSQVYTEETTAFYDPGTVTEYDIMRVSDVIADLEHSVNQSAPCYTMSNVTTLPPCNSLSHFQGTTPDPNEYAYKLAFYITLGLCLGMSFIVIFIFAALVCYAKYRGWKRQFNVAPTVIIGDKPEKPADGITSA